jgi:hypothetical protein
MGLAFDQLDPNFVRSLDEGVLDLASGGGLDLVGYFDALPAELVERIV